MHRNITIWIIALLLVAVVSVAGTVFYVGVSSKGKLVIYTTTSLYDTELLGIIEDQFEANYPINVCFISAGTGLAITHAKRGDADMILVHAPSKEQIFLEDGYGVCRKIVAYNFFSIVGPEADPAKIRDLSLTVALSRVVETGRDQGVKWISRGDDSGTHVKEKQLWTNAGFNWSVLRNEKWYEEAGGDSMGQALQVADYLNAYTLTDLGTYLKYDKEGIISLKPMVTEGEELLNAYSIIACNPVKHPHANFNGSITFLKFLISKEGQEIIANFGGKVYGHSLFYPAVNLLEQDTNSTIAQWIRNYVFLGGYECPPEYWGGHPELYT